MEPLERFKEKYGDVFTLYLGNKRTVMLCSHDAIKEAFVKQSNQFVGRPQDMFFIKEITGGNGKSLMINTIRFARLPFLFYIFVIYLA